MRRGREAGKLSPKRLPEIRDRALKVGQTGLFVITRENSGGNWSQHVAAQFDRTVDAAEVEDQWGGPFPVDFTWLARLYHSEALASKVELGLLPCQATCGRTRQKA